MSMLRVCSAAGCGTKTLGEYCVAHEPGRATVGSVAGRRVGSTVRRRSERVRLG